MSSNEIQITFDFSALGPIIFLRSDVANRGAVERCYFDISEMRGFSLLLPRR